MSTARLIPGAFLLASLCAWGQTDAYSQHERDLKMPEIITAMDLHAGSQAADIGAGWGDYEAALSRAVGGNGQVYAEDIAADSLKRLRQRIQKGHLRNVKVIQGVADDPKLPSGQLDAVLMVIMYHEVANPHAMLEHLKAALKPGGRLVIVDMTPHKTLSRPRGDQTKNHVIAPDTVESEVRAAGFEVVSRDDRFIDRPDEESTRYMFVFRKPA
ncbi:MAG TPA: methyltransferase domain-containing protein [Bryobacteraceae bacterium]|nr:methyltransferase domain-containing protein [Bryobacteraceae bacterium]